MKIRPSKLTTAVLGVALTIAGVTPLVVPGIARIGNWSEWCFVAILVGLSLTLLAAAREIIPRAPAGKHKGLITTGFLGGVGTGTDSGDGGGDGGDGGGVCGGDGGESGGGECGGP